MWIIIIALVLIPGILAAILVPTLVANKRKNGTTTVVTMESIIGEKCTVVEKIDNYAGSGLVKVKGQMWSARGVTDDDIFEVGETLHVVALEGPKLICKK